MTNHAEISFSPGLGQFLIKIFESEVFTVITIKFFIIIPLGNKGNFFGATIVHCCLYILIN